MEEKKEVAGEEETLSSQEETQEEVTEGSDETKVQEAKLYTEEEVEAIKKKMESDSEKWVQPILKKNKAYEWVLDAIGKVAEDKNYLIECYETNPETAQIILDKYYGGQTIDEFKKSIGYEIDYNDPAVREKQIELDVQKRLDSKLIEKSKSDFIEKLKMTPEEKKDFEEAFEERRQLKSFSTNDIEKHLEKAYREISDWENLKALKAQEAIAKSMATGEWKGGGGETQKKSGLQNEISDFLKANF